MIFLTQLVYVTPGREATFRQFEDIALPLVVKHGGEIVLRLRPGPDSVIAVSGEVPYEVHVIRFATDDDFGRFLRDEERSRFLHLKAESVRATLLVKGAQL